MYTKLPNENNIYNIIMFKRMLKVLVVLFIGVVLLPTISYAQAIEVTSPMTNDVWIQGQMKKITWTGGSDKVDIYLISCPDIMKTTLVRDCGYTNNPIASNIDNKGYYDWTANADANYIAHNHRYKIGVKSTNSTSTPSDDTLSDEFTITFPPQVNIQTNPGINDNQVSYEFNTSYLSAPNIRSGDYPVEILWSVNSADITCSASGDWNGVKSVSPNLRYSELLGKVSDFNTEKTYMVTCTNAAGSVSKTVKYSLEWPPGSGINPRNPVQNNPVQTVVQTTQQAYQTPVYVPTPLPSANNHTTSSSQPTTSPSVQITNVIPVITPVKVQKVVVSTIKKPSTLEKVAGPLVLDPNKSTTGSSTSLASTSTSISSISASSTPPENQNDISENIFVYVAKRIWRGIVNLF